MYNLSLLIPLHSSDMKILIFGWRKVLSILKIPTAEVSTRESRYKGAKQAQFYHSID